MSIDFSQEQLLSFPGAARRLPGNPHVSTLHRWRLRGVRGVRLETTLIGGKRYTSIEALQRFADRLNGHSDSLVPSRPATPPAARAKQIAAADRDLDRAGF
ncbi:MAG: DUF1580 domain-containing protein [Pirellulales bacterium]|nr:DUF1580 domain-containing protein [Pirellulales bacterium]